MSSLKRVECVGYFKDVLGSVIGRWLSLYECGLGSCFSHWTFGRGLVFREVQVSLGYNFFDFYPTCSSVKFCLWCADEIQTISGFINASCYREGEATFEEDAQRVPLE